MYLPVRCAFKMQVELRSHGVCIPTEDEVAQLVERLEAMDAWAKAQQRLCVPSEKRVVLVPPVAKSVVCGGTTLCPARDGRSADARQPWPAHIAGLATDKPHHVKSFAQKNLARRRRSRGPSVRRSSSPADLRPTVLSHGLLVQEVAEEDRHLPNTIATLAGGMCKRRTKNESGTWLDPKVDLAAVLAQDSE